MQCCSTLLPEQTPPPPCQMLSVILGTSDHFVRFCHRFGFRWTLVAEPSRLTAELCRRLGGTSTSTAQAVTSPEEDALASFRSVTRCISCAFGAEHDGWSLNPPLTLKSAVGGSKLCSTVWRLEGEGKKGPPSSSSSSSPLPGARLQAP